MNGRENGQLKDPTALVIIDEADRLKMASQVVEAARESLVIGAA